MIKIRATLRDKPVIVLGLSHANLDRLRADGLNGYIKVDGRELGLDTDIWITSADTEATMLRAFQGSIGPETVLHIDRKLKS